MEWEVRNQRGIILVSEQGETMTSETFQHLSGKKINWEVRVDERITTERSGGHLKVYDVNFIKGENYKKGEFIVKCEAVNSAGQGLLVPSTGHFKGVVALKTTGWEII